MITSRARRVASAPAAMALPLHHTTTPWGRQKSLLGYVSPKYQQTTNRVREFGAIPPHRRIPLHAPARMNRARIQRAYRWQFERFGRGIELVKVFRPGGSCEPV